MANENKSSLDSTIGRTIVEMGLATSEEIQNCIDLQRQLSSEQNHRTLADILLSNDVITETQLNRAKKYVDAQRNTSQQIPGYKIIEKVGAGAMATVFKAKQLSLDRIVAIKVLPKKFMSDPAFVERFYAEGRAAAKLNHANIVQAIDVGKSGEYHYFVMEFIEGHTVYDTLVDKGKYDETVAIRLVLQVAQALEHAHQKGFIHRDVKPKNIMITLSGVAKLADMGLARQVSDREAAEQEAGRAYGTPYYISPEQIRGEIDVDGRADIYGLGATFYHMVTGKVPFDGPNPSAVMHKHLKNQLTPPDHLNPTLSNGVGEVIEVMMAKNRDERYASASDLLADLRAVAKGEPPLQARKRFDIGSLAGLDTKLSGLDIEDHDGQDINEESIGSASGVPTLPGRSRDKEEAPPPQLLEQPLFWIAVGSGVLNIALIITLIVMMMS